MLYFSIGSSFSSAILYYEHNFFKKCLDSEIASFTGHYLKLCWESNKFFKNCAWSYVPIHNLIFINSFWPKKKSHFFRDFMIQSSSFAALFWSHLILVLFGRTSSFGIHFLVFVKKSLARGVIIIAYLCDACHMSQMNPTDSYIWGMNVISDIST